MKTKSTAFFSHAWLIVIENLRRFFSACKCTNMVGGIEHEVTGSKPTKNIENLLLMQRREDISFSYSKKILLTTI